MFVGQETGFDDLDVAAVTDLVPQSPQHRRRDVDGDNTSAVFGDTQRELARTRSDRGCPEFRGTSVAAR